MLCANFSCVYTPWRCWRVSYRPSRCVHADTVLHADVTVMHADAACKRRHARKNARSYIVQGARGGQQRRGRGGQVGEALRSCVHHRRNALQRQAGKKQMPHLKTRTSCVASYQLDAADTITFFPGSRPTISQLQGHAGQMGDGEALHAARVVMAVARPHLDVCCHLTIWRSTLYWLRRFSPSPFTRCTDVTPAQQRHPC